MLSIYTHIYVLYIGTHIHTCVHVCVCIGINVTEIMLNPRDIVVKTGVCLHGI